MKTLQVTSVLAFAAQTAAHGYIYSVNADNTVYPGWDVEIDSTYTPALARIAFGGGSVNPITNTTTNDLACNINHMPAPGAIAEVRAGSNISFHWSRWLYSHKGPITAWMAPYEGSVDAIDVNKLAFFKIKEETVGADGIWANVRMMNFTNDTYTATIPADIKPGTYIIRNEIVALHFALSVPANLAGFNSVGPQFYPTCFNLRVTGSGTATPLGVNFPGAYSATDPGLKFDVYSNDTNYPSLGPAVYKSKTSVALEPKSLTVVSPTGNDAADADYYAKQVTELEGRASTSAYFDSIGG
ncbi:uncharacterized protein BP5553_08235 [Venustampulla echinocandica]|uniref:lytic cellulose monooxygenase (C4-dehydrogenating) n=1 Tax=Venustampulla echinocandica TaxID=2656787 RepID=A0A370TG37_9HELO|nr:uncharacterized protein BP5553_08235 [Venustampulla echinocandica]RDL33867.1 hypothetical protein BP5553_08235 [Venustampulla echinocandica]